MNHREFAPEGNTVNSESYLEVLEKLLLKQDLQTKLHFPNKQTNKQKKKKVGGGEEAAHSQ